MQSWEESLRELREEFVTSSRERLSGMATLAEALERDSGDLAAHEALRRHFHGLAGSGTTYGFPRVTELGLVGELRLQPVEGEAVPPLSGSQLLELRALMADVRDALEAGPEGG